MHQRSCVTLPPSPTLPHPLSLCLHTAIHAALAAITIAQFLTSTLGFLPASLTTAPPIFPIGYQLARFVARSGYQPSSQQSLNPYQLAPISCPVWLLANSPTNHKVNSNRPKDSRFGYSEKAPTNTRDSVSLEHSSTVLGTRCLLTVILTPFFGSPMYPVLVYLALYTIEPCN